MTAITDTQAPVGDNGIDLWCKGGGVSVKQRGPGSRSHAGGDHGIPPGGRRYRQSSPAALCGEKREPALQF